jgi:serine phosphatase RsbU (regulator of sigma subunit)
MPSLVLVKAPNGAPTNEQYPLDGDLFVLGRDADTCQIVIPNNTVSKRHAQITRAGGQFYLEDLKSRNHTFLNNKEVTVPTPLKPEDRIKICDFLFRYYDERAAPERRKVPLYQEDQDVDEEPSGGSTTIEHTFQRGQAQQFLDAQPAERVRALLDISASLSKTLDLETLLGQIADTLFAVFRGADRCFIVLANDEGKLVPRVIRNRRPGAADDQRYSRTIVRKTIDSGQAFLSADATNDSNLGPAASIAEFKIRSVMCAPVMTGDGTAIGAIQIDTQDRGRKFREDDLKMLTVVGNMASVAIEKAHLHVSALAREKEQNEIELAKKVQLGLLPQVFPKVTGYEFFAAYSAAQSVGGDYYDFIPLPDGRVAVVLGDVAGKGVPASLLMAKLGAEAKFCMLTQPGLTPAVMLLNDTLIRGGIGDRFVTLAAGVLDPAEHACELANAGHLNPLHYRAESASFVEAVTNDQSGLPLGITPGYPYGAVRVPLAPGDFLLFFTDGVTDAQNPAGEMFGLEGLKRAVTGGPFRPKTVGELVLGAVRKHANGRPQNDDIALVCFGRVDDVPTSTFQS